MKSKDMFFEHLYYEDISTYTIMPTADDDNIVELICKIPISKGALVKRNDNILKLGSDATEAPKFEELTKDLGMKLLSPLLGNCFLHVSSQTKIRDSIERRYLVIQILCWEKHRVVSR